MATSAEYYEDVDSHGNYQYVLMSDIVNEFMMSLDPDDFVFGVRRFRVLHQARKAFKELYYDVVQEIRAIELELSPTLTVTLPPDFVNYVRISWVDDKGQLHPMSVDDKMSIAQVYLQDNDYEILFDEVGCVLQSTEEGLDLDPITGEAIPEGSISGGMVSCYQFAPNRDMSRVFTNGTYKIDKSAGVIRFGSEVFGKDVVLEYISDGLFVGCEGKAESKLSIHKFAEEAVNSYIYWQLIMMRRNVPQNEKLRARKEYFNNRRIAKRRLKTLRVAELMQYFRGANKWV